MEEVLAPMPGNIIEILVNVGDAVREDDKLLILEPMKMENTICAPADGTVKEIAVMVELSQGGLIEHTMPHCFLLSESQNPDIYTDSSDIQYTGCPLMRP